MLTRYFVLLPFLLLSFLLFLSPLNFSLLGGFTLAEKVFSLAMDWSGDDEGPGVFR